MCVLQVGLPTSPTHNGPNGEPGHFPHPHTAHRKGTQRKRLPNAVKVQTHTYIDTSNVSQVFRYGMECITTYHGEVSPQCLLPVSLWGPSCTSFCLHTSSALFERSPNDENQTPGSSDDRPTVCPPQVALCQSSLSPYLIHPAQPYKRENIHALEEMQQIREMSWKVRTSTPFECI